MWFGAAYGARLHPFAFANPCSWAPTGAGAKTATSPTGLPLVAVGTMASRISRLRECRAIPTRMPFGSGSKSGTLGSLASDTDRKRASLLRLARSHDSTSRNEAARNAQSIAAPVVRFADGTVVGDGHGREAVRVVGGGHHGLRAHNVIKAWTTGFTTARNRRYYEC